MQFHNIEEYNQQLINTLSHIGIKDYLHIINNEFNLKFNPQFIDYFLHLHDNRNKFVVTHAKAKEYGAINIDNKGDIKKWLTYVGLIYKVDYNDNLDGDFYVLTPFAFKVCLMKSRVCKIDIKDYAILEEITFLFAEYDKKITSKMLMLKDIQIDTLSYDNEQLSLTNSHNLFKINNVIKCGNLFHKTLQTIVDDNIPNLE